MRLRPLFVTSALCFLSQVQPAIAETIECGSGDVQCLIAAVSQANADPKKTIIYLVGGTYLLTNIDNVTNGPNGLPSIVTPIKIESGEEGATLARAADAPEFRFFNIGSAGDLTLDGVTLTGGVGRHIDGGAIFNDRGKVTMIDVALTQNFASLTGAVSNSGGTAVFTRTLFERNISDFGTGALSSINGEVRISQSIFLRNSGLFGPAVEFVAGTLSIDKTTFNNNFGLSPMLRSTATAFISDSTFVGNFSGDASAAAISNGGTMRVTNTSFLQNRGSRFCGGIVSNSGALTLTNTTFAQNIYNCPDGGFVTPILGVNPTRLQNTIVSHDTEDLPSCIGPFTSLGNNLLDPAPDTDPKCPINLLQPTDLIAEAALGVLTDDGTPGNAHVPLLGESPAIDAAKAAACTKKDQIGQPRQPKCDIGAVEFY
jgi:hypothetical protein